MKQGYKHCSRRGPERAISPSRNENISSVSSLRSTELPPPLPTKSCFVCRRRRCCCCCSICRWPIGSSIGSLVTWERGAHSCSTLIFSLNFYNVAITLQTLQKHQNWADTEAILSSQSNQPPLHPQGGLCGHGKGFAQWLSTYHSFVTIAYLSPAQNFLLSLFIHGTTEWDWPGKA